jgi:predicted regulator of Ras-like GTPase activity (Roadblock/LC7/MglB family)
MTKLEQIIIQFRGELGGDFITSDIVGMDGISIAGASLDPNFNSSDASARFAEVMKLAVKISKRIDIGQVEDNLVSTDKTYIISRFLGDGTYYWVVVVTSNATLGTLRMLMNEYAPQLWDAIPKDLSPKIVAVVQEKPTEEKKEDVKPKNEKSRANFWADATPKEDRQKDEEKNSKPKSEKPRGSFWADATPKEEDVPDETKGGEKDDSALKTFQYP